MNQFINLFVQYFISKFVNRNLKLINDLSPLSQTSILITLEDFEI